MRRFLPVLFLATCGCMQAGTIVAQTGSVLSFLSVCQSSCNQTMVFGFTLGQSYDNVNIEADSAGNPTTGLAYLTTSIGPGTTVASEITHQTNTLAAPRFGTDGTYNTVLLLPNLGPGTYYVTLAANPQYGGDFFVTNSPSSVGDPGNSALVIPDFSQDTLGGGYAPAANFGGSFGSVLFQIDATASVPEPGTLALFGLGLPCAFLIRRFSIRRR